MRRLTLVLTLGGVAMFAMAGCAGGAASSAPAGAPAASTPAETVAPSVGVVIPSDLPIPSFAIPSFELPSSDKELEALLPSTLCGATALKLSMSGDQFVASADATLKTLLVELGKTPADVSVAIAAGQTGGCSAGILRIKGTDAESFKQGFIDGSAAENTVYQESTIGGKNVLVGPVGAEFQYVYFKGDAMIFVTGGTDAQAAEVLLALP